MHFFYLDEPGGTGANLRGANQPTIVLGGIGVRWAALVERNGRKMQHVDHGP